MVSHPVLQREDGGFVDIDFDGNLRFAGTHVAVGAGGVEDARYQQLLSEVGTFVEKDLEMTKTRVHVKNLFHSWVTHSFSCHWSTNRPTGLQLPSQDLQPLQHNEAGDDGVGRCDGWDDVPRHGCRRQTTPSYLHGHMTRLSQTQQVRLTFDIEATLHVHAEDVHS